MRRSLFLKPVALSLFVLAACALASAQAKAKPEADKKPRAVEETEFVAVGPLAEASITPAVRRDVLRLIELMRIVETEMKTVDPLIEQLKQRSPQVPPRVWDDVRRDILKDFNPQSLRDTYLPLFASRFTAAELRSLVRFYSSPVGRKFVEKIKDVEAEAFLIGVERGVRIGERIRARLKALGYETNIG